MTLSYAEAHRWFQTVKHDRWYREQCPMTAKHLAAAMQVHVSQAGYLIRGVMNVSEEPGTTRRERGMTQRMLAKAEQIMYAVESGRLVFWRSGYAWIVAPPGPHIFAQRSLVESAHWDYWRECGTCGSRKYLPIWMNGGGVERDQAWVACYRCQHPSQWRTFGARARTEILAARLIPEILSEDGLRPKNVGMPQPALQHGV